MNKISILDEYKCVVFKDDLIIYRSKESGIKPIINLIDNKINVEKGVVYDTIVGKAAALLYSLVGVSKIYTKVASEKALQVLQQYNIEIEYITLVKEIINRQNTGICPMEETVLSINNPKIALIALKNKIKKLQKDGVLMKNTFEKVQSNFGFGLMRLPMLGDEVDFEQTKIMVDQYMACGHNYFDTAHGYINGKSEIALRECVVKRYPRESFTITNKLSSSFFETEEDIYKVFEEQLLACGTDYFDFYLMHAQSKSNYDKYQKCHAYEAAQKLKELGKVKHVGLSFHDTAEMLDQILNDHPEVELVQIQLNYVDYNDAGVQSKLCLDVCNKHHKPVVIMEPVKGGHLVNLPKEADDLFRSLNNGSNVSYAIRFAATQPGVFMVLSGMSNIEQMEDNLSFMTNFIPLNQEELATIQKVCQIFNNLYLIPCTKCGYCLEGCPQRILIPTLFADLNAKNVYKDWNSDFYYSVHTKENGKASACIKCGKCERACPQHLPIRSLLEQVVATFEKKNQN